MKKKQKQKFVHLFTVFLIAFLIVLVLMFAPSKNQVCYNFHCFDVEIADTPQERTQGLMYRESIAEDTGMLFVFQEEKSHPFWMKNTELYLDIIWMNSDKEIVYISKNTPPCGFEVQDCPLYDADQNTLYVLEVNSGTADKLGMKEGDILRF